MPEVTATSEDERAAGGDANPVEGAVRAFDRFSSATSRWHSRSPS
jgi:hypothetical protein